MQVNVCIYKFFLFPFIAFLFAFKHGFKKVFTCLLFFNKSRFIFFFHLHSFTVCHLKVEIFLILQLFWSVCCFIVHTWLSVCTGRVGSGRKTKGNVGNYRGKIIYFWLKDWLGLPQGMVVTLHFLKISKQCFKCYWIIVTFFLNK